MSEDEQPIAPPPPALRARTPIALAAAASLGLVALPFLSRLIASPPDILLFFGRLHLVVLHLPIGMLAALLAVEAAHRLFRHHELRPATALLLALTTLSTWIAVLFGSLLALGGGYDPDLLRWHRWAGTAVALFLLWALVLRILNRTAHRRGLAAGYGLCLVGAALAIVPAGHHGGSLTHGSDFLFAHLPEGVRGLFQDPEPPPTPAAENPTETAVFADTILPLFETYCTKCHGAEKQKEDLRLDSYEAVMFGSGYGPVVTPGDPEDSPLVAGIVAPLDADEHMPPEGKPQPTPEEIALITAWVQDGAPEFSLVSPTTLGE